MERALVNGLGEVNDFCVVVIKKLKNLKKQKQVDNAANFVK